MLQAGFSMRVITPKENETVFLGGYAARNHNAEGVHDDLFAKAIYLDDGRTHAAVVSLDVVGVMQDQFHKLRERIRLQCGIQNVIVTATHNHSAPDTRLRMRSVNGAWCDRMIDEAVSAVCEAHKALAPVQLFAGFTHVPEVARNRRGEETVDDELFALRAVDQSGKTRGILVNYACHCTVLDASNYFITADYPADLYRKLSAEFENAPVLFTNAACGNINIGYSADASALGMDMGDIRSYTNAERKAGALKSGVLEIFQREELLDPDLRFRTFSLAMPLKSDLPSKKELKERITHNDMLLKTAKDSEKTRLEIAKVYDACVLDNLEEYHTEGRDHIETEISLLRIGDIVLITAPVELFCEIGLEIKKSYLPDYRAVILGYANGYFGYLPTSEAQQKGGYECDTSVHSVDGGEQFYRNIAAQRGTLK